MTRYLRALQASTQGLKPALIELLPIAAVPPVAIESLLDAAFGTDRHGRTAYKLRVGMDAIPGLSLAAVEDGELVGSIQCWPIQLTEADGEAHNFQVIVVRQV